MVAARPRAPAPAGNAAGRLARLLESAHAGQWSAERDLDWDLPLRPPRWMPRRIYGGIIAQLRAGEVATAALCRHLATVAEDSTVAALLAVQSADEERHAAVYARYLDRLGIAGGADPQIEAVFARGLAWRGADLAPIVAYHVVLEGEALKLHEDFLQDGDCPLFRALNRRILRDEGRHIAFGKIHLARRLARLPRAERLEILDWVHALWWDCSAALRRRWPAARALTPYLSRHLSRRGLEARWRRHERSLVALGLVSAVELVEARGRWHRS